MQNNFNDEWDYTIEPKTGWFNFKFRELLEYRDLIFLFVKRNFSVMYKQTILGPFWLILSPLMSTFMFTIVFGQIAQISTDGVPQFLFYLSGNTMWGYFSSCLNKTSSTFTSNTHLFGKVYFPRLAVPLSVVITNLLSFSIQFLLFLILFVYYRFTVGGIFMTPYCLLLPFLILQMAVLGMGMGLFLSSLTAKYRDLSVLISLCIQLWMYATPIVYPASLIPKRFYTIFMLNPMTPIMECFRCGFLGTGFIPWKFYGISILETGIILFIGLFFFFRIERTFMDTV